MSIWNLFGGSSGGSLQPSMGPNSMSDPGALNVGDMLSRLSPSGGGGAGAGGMASFGWNIPTAQVGLSALGALGNLWNGWQAQNLAKNQFDLVKRTTETNLANQLRSYNTALEDRARARGVTEGQSAEQVSDYINRNRLTR